MKFDGKVIRYQDNVDTDVIIPARYLNTIDKKELASHCMEDLDSTFGERVKSCSIIVAGNNFGCGSSREHAPLAIKESGVSLVIAKSFARIFYRNAINIGLAIFECPEAAEGISDGDELRQIPTQASSKTSLQAQSLRLSLSRNLSAKSLPMAVLLNPSERAA